MTTATATWNERMFEAMLSEFLTRYKPDDPIEANRFHIDLIMLVRQVYTDAQAPVLEHLSRRAMSVPTVFTSQR